MQIPHHWAPWDPSPVAPAPSRSLEPWLPISWPLAATPRDLPHRDRRPASEWDSDRPSRRSTGSRAERRPWPCIPACRRGSCTSSCWSSTRTTAADLGFHRRQNGAFSDRLFAKICVERESEWERESGVTRARGRHGRRWRWLGDLRRWAWGLRSRLSKWFSQRCCSHWSSLSPLSLPHSISLSTLVWFFLLFPLLGTIPGRKWRNFKRENQNTCGRAGELRGKHYDTDFLKKIYKYIYIYILINYSVIPELWSKMPSGP